MSVRNLSEAIKKAVDLRIEMEARAKRGIIKNGMFHSGTKAYQFKQAVDCNLNGRVWAQLDKNGRAVIIGA